MGKSEVQPLHTLIRCIQRVILLLLPGHRIPGPVAHFIAPDIEPFDQVEQNNIEAADCKKNLISTTVQRLIVFTVDVCSDWELSVHNSARRAEG